jgi:hypothetical protein
MIGSAGAYAQAARMPRRLWPAVGVPRDSGPGTDVIVPLAIGEPVGLSDGAYVLVRNHLSEMPQLRSTTRNGRGRIRVRRTERAEAPIAIAHPDHRDQLERDPRTAGRPHA